MATTHAAALERRRARARALYAEKVGRPVRARARPEEAADLGPEDPPAPELPLRRCMGCRAPGVRGWGYCPKCKARLRCGCPLDLDEFPTVRELADAGIIAGGARRNR